MSSPRFPVHVDADGRLLPLYPERTKRYAGREVWVSIHEKPATMRSLPSLRLQWALYGEIARATGNDPTTVHQAAKREAVKIGIIDPVFIISGSKLLEIEPTTVVEQEAHIKYIDWIRHECIHGGPNSFFGMQIDISGIGAE